MIVLINRINLIFGILKQSNRPKEISYIKTEEIKDDKNCENNKTLN